jgi:hypothetical protein
MRKGMLVAHPIVAATCVTGMGGWRSTGVTGPLMYMAHLSLASHYGRKSTLRCATLLACK